MAAGCSTQAPDRLSVILHKIFLVETSHKNCWRDGLSNINKALPHCLSNAP
jgi:hypothetical protein